MTSKDPNKSQEIARPSDIFSRFRQEMDDFISGFSRGLPDSPFNQVFGGGGFAVDVSESDNSVDITAELPGLESSDIDVSVEGGSLTISAEKKNEEKSEGKNWHRVERSYGSFNRSASYRMPTGSKPAWRRACCISPCRNPPNRNRRPRR